MGLLRARTHLLLNEGGQTRACVNNSESTTELEDDDDDDDNAELLLNVGGGNERSISLCPLGCGAAAPIERRGNKRFFLPGDREARVRCLI